MQVQKVHSSMLFMKDFTTFTAPFEMDFRYMLWVRASDSAVFFCCACASLLKEYFSY